MSRDHMSQVWLEQAKKNKNFDSFLKKKKYEKSMKKSLIFLTFQEKKKKEKNDFHPNFSCEKKDEN